MGQVKDNSALHMGGAISFRIFQVVLMPDMGEGREQLERMTMSKTALERAFGIARAGVCGTIKEIRRQLTREGFDWCQVEGRTLRRQFTVRKAREAKFCNASPL